MLLGWMQASLGLGLTGQLGLAWLSSRGVLLLEGDVGGHCCGGGRGGAQWGRSDNFVQPTSY